MIYGNGGRVYGIRMKATATKFTKGMTLVYNDGRAGHVNVKCVVLCAGRTSMRVMFEDRADTTTIGYSDAAWMDFLSVAQ